MCAGSGASVLFGAQADLYVTGEMSHHELLDSVHAGVSVILCEHSNTERGFLPVLAQSLDDLFEKTVSIHVSVVDRDPVIIM